MSCCRRAAEAATRVVHANDPAANAPARFPDNTISNTKYNVVTFIPYNLAEQFGRAMNVYFLLIACLQLVAIITPVNPLTTWLPLAVIFGVTAVKEGIDDLGRARADKAANSRKYAVVRDSRRQQVLSRDIHVGDVVYLKDNDEVPCDLVILSSSDPKGRCFVQTTNLDGESNLKVRSALAHTAGLMTESALSAFQGAVECAAPNEHIYQFDSQLRLGGGVHALTAAQLLLQATHLRNTSWVYGLAVYTGNETKFGKNKKTPPTKYTRTDDFISTVSVCIFLFQLLLVLVFGAIGNNWNVANGRAAWYLDIPSSVPGYDALIIPARYLLLNSTMIPISLKLTMDMAKLAYARYINADAHLVDAASGVGAISNSTSLSEDLGQIKYVLTDKTGTLTENRMVLKVVNIGGAQYGTFDAAGAADNLAAAPPGAPYSHTLPDTPAVPVASPGDSGAALPPSLANAAKSGIMISHALYMHARAQAASGERDGAVEFLRCLAITNDVVPAVGEDGRTRHYKASSPDEEALVKAAQAYGVTLWEREGETVALDVFAAQERYMQLAAFEFTSDRKRMSVMVRSLDTDAVRLYCKGADDMIMARLQVGQDTTVAAVQRCIDACAEAGLRTLVMSYRDIPADEYAAFRAEYDRAAAALTDRDAAKEAVYTMMERDLRLLGATAIEDKLQNAVPETIGLLKQAGVSFWMLTGDKLSTALTIAHTCNLKPAANTLIEIKAATGAEVGAALDRACTDVRARGYQIEYAPVPTGWRGTLSTLTGGLLGGARSRPPHRPIVTPGGPTYNLVMQEMSPPAPLPAVPTGAAESSPSVDGVAATSVAMNPMSVIGRNSGGTLVAPRAGVTPLAPYTVVVTGAALEHALHRHRTKLGALCLSADSVICCRVTPKQKGELVRLVKEAGHLTLAIGDGGNDVAMIQEAAVGVGIRGKEGLQAARASDYQVPFFRALQRLLLIHGRYSYYRTSIIAQYSFYKSFLFCVMQIAYGFFSGYAGVSLFNSLCVAAYNVVVFVPIVLFIVDRDVTQATALAQPQAYRQCNEGTFMTARTMAWWLWRGLWQAALICALGLLFVDHARSSDYESAGLVVYFGYTWVQDFTMLLTLRRVTWIGVLSIFGMHLIALVGMIALNMSHAFTSLIDLYSLSAAVRDPVFWLHHAAVAIACTVPVEAWRNWHMAFSPSFEFHLWKWDRQLEWRLGTVPAADVGGVGPGFTEGVLAAAPKAASAPRGDPALAFVLRYAHSGATARLLHRPPSVPPVGLAPAAP